MLHPNYTTMKTELFKSFSHEVGYIVASTIILVVLSLLVFPLFIALLPIVLYYGCREIWHMDHLKNGESG